MWLRIIKEFLDLSSKLSLRVRFMLVLLINSITIFAMVGFISYYNLKSVYESKVQNGIQSELNSIYLKIESTYGELSNITKQFAYENTVLTDSGIGNDLQNYINYVDSQQRHSESEILGIGSVTARLSNNVSFIVSLDASMGFAAFYRTGNPNEVVFSSITVNEKTFDSSQISPMYNDGYMVANGIHKSIGGGNYPVLSAERKVALTGMDNIFVYVETSNKFLKDLFRKKEYGMSAVFLMTDSNNVVVYSQNETNFPVGEKLNFSGNGDFAAMGNYQLFRSNESGWRIVEAIQKNSYNREIVKWMSQFILVVFISLCITALLTLFIWRTMYRPVKAFRREFQLMAENRPNPKIRRTRVKEFDELLIEFYQARSSVTELHKQIEQKEKRQKELEIEKLLIQINPHFIHNTLNSMQWMARMAGQKDIEKMVTLFTRVLNYNLGKNDIIVTMNEEITALGNYIELQKMKNKLDLDVVISVDQPLKEAKIPRFILQPLVENAIFYGSNPDGDSLIRVTAAVVDDKNFRITVEDNGKGMTPEMVYTIMNNGKSSRKPELGIGLKYVNGMIQFYYGEQYHIQIESQKGKGTVISLLLPINIDEDNYDKCIDC